MATDAVVLPASSTKPAPRRINRTAERVFYTGMAIVMCLSVYIGFNPTYFRVGHPALPSPILHVHGAVFTLWMLLFTLQAAFVSARRVQWHRSLGTVAFCLPPLMVVLGTWAAIDALRRGVRIGPLDPATSLSFPLIGIVAFSVVIYASWRARRQPDAHKRLILLATIGLLGAAFGRFPWDRAGIPLAAGPSIGVGGLILLLIAFELVMQRRLHRSTMWAAPLIFAAATFAVPIGMTHPWHVFASWLM